MLKLLIDNTIPNIDVAFSKHFQISRYLPHEDISSLLKNQDVLVCRSYSQITNNMINHSQLKVIATASSGSEHIQVTRLPIIDAKGCNAAAVCDYIFSIFAKININTQQTIGIIGYGHVGSLLSQRLHDFGYTIKIYDPLTSVPSLWACDFQDIKACEVILLHANYHQDGPFGTHHLINEHFLSQLTDNTILINASRGSIIDEKALLKSSWQGIFCTDVYEGEPLPNPDIIERATICTPHIAGHSIEAKARITDIVSQKIHHFFKLPYEVQETYHKIQIQKDFWKSDILDYYDPSHETQILKKDDSKEAFLELRAKHHRHEFEFV